MKTITYSEVRQNLKQYLDTVNDTREPIIIERRGGKEVTLIDTEDYNSLVETAYLLRSPANAQRLIQSLAEAKKGKAVAVDLQKVMEAAGKGKKEKA